MTNLKHGQDLSDHLKQVKEQDEADKRIEACQKELLEVLTKHDCQLDAVMMVSRGGCVPQITILANKKS